MTREAFKVVDQFEAALAAYTGAPFVVTTDSCTNALYLCFKWLHISSGKQKLKIPKRTYVGVPRAAINAGHEVEFFDDEWVGEYGIATKDGPIIDAARWLRGGMYEWFSYTCVSFQATKHLSIGRGGAILCDDEEEAEWFRRARFDGRDQNVSLFDQKVFGFGIHAYMTPPDAARGLWLLQNLPKDNKPIPGSYPDLSLVKFS